MRILVVTHNYPRFPGDPAGAFVARIAAGAAGQGMEVQVVAPHAPGSPERESKDGVDIHRFRYGPDSLERVAYTGDLHRKALFSPLAALSFPAFMLAFKRAIRDSVKQARPDLIHAHWWMPGGWLSSRMGAPYLVTCHGSDVRLLEKWSAFRHLAGPVFARAGAITTVSHFLAADLRHLMERDLPHLVVAPMPVDSEHFARGRAVSKAAPPRILYAGNLLPSKGVDILIEAYALLRSRGVACGLRILGEGPDRRTLEEQAARSAGSAEIEFSDFVPQDQMPVEYGQSSVTVLPTRGDAEGLGLTLVEALMAGSAVVGTRAGGIPEVIQDGETGLLAGESAGELAVQLERMITDRSLRDRLISTGQARVEARFSTRTATEHFLRLYRDVTQHH
jgi:glycosyltransferase involved in cell wall biosynthesis